MTKPVLSSSKGRGSGGNPQKDTSRAGGWVKRVDIFFSPFLVRLSVHSVEAAFRLRVGVLGQGALEHCVDVLSQMRRVLRAGDDGVDMRMGQSET